MLVDTIPWFLSLPSSIGHCRHAAHPYMNWNSYFLWHCECHYCQLGCLQFYHIFVGFPLFSWQGTPRTLPLAWCLQPLLEAFELIVIWAWGILKDFPLHRYKFWIHQFSYFSACSERVAFSYKELFDNIPWIWLYWKNYYCCES